MNSVRRLGWVLAFVVLATLLRADASGAGIAEVFRGPAAEYEQVPPVAVASGSDRDQAGVMRWVWVEERMNVPRKNAPVRVPLFLAAGECRNLDELQLVRWPSREPVPMQPDDIRRGPDGGIARLHLWFTTDLSAGEHRRFALVRRSPASARTARSIETRMVAGHLEISDRNGSVLFDGSGNGRRPLLALQTKDGPDLEFPGGVGATVTWKGGTVAKKPAPVVAKKPPVIWGTGPVFAKVIARFDDEAGATVVQTFRVFDDGSLNIVQTIQPFDQASGVTLETQDFANGTVKLPRQLTLQSQTAEIVDTLVGVHPGYVVDAFLSPGQSNGWLIVPGSLGGVAGRVKLDPDGHFQIQGPGELTPGLGDARPGTVKAFWAEVTFVPARREGSGLDRAALLAAGQPLVGVVERPGVSLAMAIARLRDNVQEMKPVGWINESLIRFLNGKPDPFPRRNWAAESDPEAWVTSAEKAKAKVTGNSSRPLQEAEKGRAAGALDPYHFTYGTTALVYWLLRGDLPDPVLKSLRAQMEAVRKELGRTNDEGWPYLDVFFRTQNMQMGPPLLTLADAGADPELRRYYRDQLSAPTVQAVMLRGLRPYAGSAQTKPGESDTLYQAVVDFMLRATELSMNESLGLQPVAFGRYLDAIDVNADLYHPVFQRSVAEGGDRLFARANFFRTQSHLHRWLAWGPAPFVALLQVPPGKGTSFPGATEAWQFANMLSGQWKNWPDQSWLFLASILPDRAATYNPATRPAAVKAVHCRHLTDGNHVAWDRQPDAIAYRVYRLRNGFPPLWVDSPYRGGKKRDDSIERIDPEGKPDDAYLVHAMDKDGRESAW